MKRCMKKYKVCIYISHVMIVYMVSAGWWGILYPEFGFSQDTYCVVAEQGEQETKYEEQQPVELETKNTGADVFRKMLEAEPGQIKIKSKLLEEVFGIRGNENEQQCTDRDFRFGSGRTDGGT